MKTKDDWKVEIQKILSEKMQAGIDKYRSGRDQLFDDLGILSQRLDEVEAKVKELTQERSKLNPLIPSELGRANEIDRTFFRMQKDVKSLRAQVDAVIQRLTAIPEAGEAWLNFLVQLKREKL